MSEARLALIAAPLILTTAVSAELLDARPLSAFSLDWWMLGFLWVSAPAQAYAFYIRSNRDDGLRRTAAKGPAFAIAVIAVLPWLVGFGLFLWSLGWWTFLSGLVATVLLGVATREVEQDLKARH